MFQNWSSSYIFTNDNTVDFEIPGTLGIVHSHKTWLQERNKERRFPFINPKDYLAGVETHPKLNFIYAFSCFS